MSTNYIFEGDIDVYAELNKIINDEDVTNNIEVSDSQCLISGDELNKHHVRLNCGHSFNYIPLLNEVKKYILEQSEYRFIDYLRELKDIHFYDTVDMFEDLNSIFLVYYEFNEKLKQNKTKKIYFKSHNPTRLRKTKRNSLKKSQQTITQ